jgi:hypothetical protein
VLELVQKGEVVTGSIKSPEGELPISGSSKGSDVSLAFTYNETRVTLTGKVSGDTIAGPATFGDERGDWSGKRTSAAAPAGATPQTGAVDVSGAWAIEVTTPGGPATSTATFNQSGEKLSGTYVGQFGETPLQGTIRGSELTFSIDVTVQDMKLHVVYSGTVAKDTIKGTATFGEAGEGTFSAVRK